MRSKFLRLVLLFYFILTESNLSASKNGFQVLGTLHENGREAPDGYVYRKGDGDDYGIKMFEPESSRVSDYSGAEIFEDAPLTGRRDIGSMLMGLDSKEEEGRSVKKAKMGRLGRKGKMGRRGKAVMASPDEEDSSSTEELTGVKHEILCKAAKTYGVDIKGCDEESSSRLEMPSRNLGDHVMLVPATYSDEDAEEVTLRLADNDVDDHAEDEVSYGEYIGKPRRKERIGVHHGNLFKSVGHVERSESLAGSKKSSKVFDTRGGGPSWGSAEEEMSESCSSEKLEAAPRPVMHAEEEVSHLASYKDRTSPPVPPRPDNQYVASLLCTEICSILKRLSMELQACRSLDKPRNPEMSMPSPMASKTVSIPPRNPVTKPRNPVPRRSFTQSKNRKTAPVTLKGTGLPDVPYEEVKLKCIIED